MVKRIAAGLGALLLSTALTASAAVVVVYGANSNNEVATFLNTHGHVATNVGGPPPTAADLVGVDAVIALRVPGNAALQNFVLGGGLLITEWSAAEWALDEANLLNANGGGILEIGTDTPITITPAGLALGLGTGLANPFSDGARTEFQWTLEAIGAGVDILATRAGDIPVIIGGAAGAGYAFINSLDWADEFPTTLSPSGQMLLNALALQPSTRRVPEPATLLLLVIGVLAFVARRPKRPASEAA